MAIPEDLNSRDRESLIESTDVQGQTGRVVLNPDGTSISGGGGSVTQYDEDTAHSSGDTGMLMLTVREDSLGASLADTVGDYSVLKTDGNGRLYVNNYAAAAHDTAASNVFTQSTGSEAKDFDGSALPNAVNAEGDLVRNAASLSGVQYVMPVSEDGSSVAGTAQESSSMTVAGASVTPKFAVIDVASAGDNTLIAAVVGKKIRVLSYTIIASADVTVRFESGAGGTALTGQMQVAGNGGVHVAYSSVGHFETATNTLLNLELSGATSVDGHLTYIEV
jgi:hypothetical protein